MEAKSQANVTGMWRDGYKVVISRPRAWAPPVKVFFEFAVCQKLKWNPGEEPGFFLSYAGVSFR
jgi:hypothetical protein